MRRTFLGIGRTGWCIVALLLILAGSLWLNLHHNYFPLGLHIDERRKVRFILDNHRDFKHPQLILKLGRLLAALKSAETGQEVVVAGRVSTALLGTALCGITFAVGRRFLSAPAALLAAAITAVSPGIVVHSHYLKEDIAMACFSMAALLVGLEVIATLRSGDPDQDRRRGRRRWLTLLWALTLGLAIASKYTAIVLLPIFAVLPFLMREIPKAPYLLLLGWASAGSVLVFLGLNHELLLDPQEFSGGVEFELGHALKGHAGIRLFPWHTFFLFHLQHSILPSLGWLPTALALIGMVLTALPRRSVPWPARILLLYTVVLYLVLEGLPLKPHPGYVRYVVPLLPPLACFAAFSVQTLIRRCRPRPAVALSALLALLLLIPPLARSLTLSHWLLHDARLRLPELLEGSREPIAVEDDFYTGLPRMDHAERQRFVPIETVLHIDHESIDHESIDHESNASESNDSASGDAPALCTLVTSSFSYQRYFDGARYRGQEPSVYRAREAYADLFSRGRRDLNPGEPSFSFINPTLTAVDLCGPPDQRTATGSASAPP